MNSKHRKTLRAIFAKPTSPSIVFSDIESRIIALGCDLIIALGCDLIIALGCDASKREGSRVKITLRGEQWRCHRPHPGKEAKHYQVEEVRELLERVGELP